MIVDYSKLNSAEYLKGLPFPNIVIDDLFDSDFMTDVESSYPEMNSISWFKYDNVFEKKLASNSINLMSKEIQMYFDIVNSRDFVKNVEKLTGIDNLISDPSLYGGGLHRIERGGKLDVHADFNYHKKTGWKRRLNIITYLNKEWLPEYGGHVEFWDRDMSGCVKKVLPTFNRTVIFLIDDYAYHGHPTPLSCPVGFARKSLATYYYTLHDDDLSKINLRSTDYKKRPNDLSDKKKEIMREQRRKGRLGDLKT